MQCEQEDVLCFLVRLNHPFSTLFHLRTQVLTHYPRKMGELSYSLSDGDDAADKKSGDEDDEDEDDEDEDEDDEDGKKKKKQAAINPADLDPAAFRRKTRSQDEAIAAKNRELEARAKERREHQFELYKKKQEEVCAAAGSAPTEISLMLSHLV